MGSGTHISPVDVSGVQLRQHSSPRLAEHHFLYVDRATIGVEKLIGGGGGDGDVVRPGSEKEHRRSRGSAGWGRK